MVVFRFLERLIQLLNIPLTITGVLAFFGYNLNVQAVRAALDTTLPDHFAVAFARLTWLDYVWFAGYVGFVFFSWHTERFADKDRQREAEAEGMEYLLRFFLPPFLIVGGGLVTSFAFAATLFYLVADLLSPECAIVESATRCADQGGLVGLVSVVGSLAFTLGSTQGAMLLGAVQRRLAKEAGSGNPEAED